MRTHEILSLKEKKLTIVEKIFSCIQRNSLHEVNLQLIPKDKGTDQLISEYFYIKSRRKWEYLSDCEYSDRKPKNSQVFHQKGV